MKTKIFLLLFLVLWGCATVGPDYKKPEVKIPSKWSIVEKGLFSYNTKDLESWWNYFNDPKLSTIIQQTIEKNIEIKKSLARIEEAKAQLSYVAGGRFPSIDIEGSVERTRQSESVNPKASPVTSYGSFFSSFWEIDLFGRIRRSIEAASADLQVTEEDFYFLTLSLCAESAKNYFLLWAYQNQLRATLKNIESQREILEIVKARFEAGLSSELDVLQAEETLALWEAKIPPLRSSIEKLKYNLALLMGSYMEEVKDLLAEPIEVSIPEKLFPIGIPSDLLRRRPDIRSAERKLAGETARIGVAMADLYPTLSLAGTIGIESIGAGDFAKISSLFYGFGSTLKWSIFDAGRIRSKIKIADARVEQALEDYKLSVLKAINEVETSLVEYGENLNKVKALEKSIEASSKVLETSLDLYKSGLTSFKNVLDAQRNLFDQENQLAQAKGDLLVSLVNIYKALGGSWEK